MYGGCLNVKTAPEVKRWIWTYHGMIERPLGSPYVGYVCAQDFQAAIAERDEAVDGMESFAVKLAACERNIERLRFALLRFVCLETAECRYIADSFDAPHDDWCVVHLSSRPCRVALALEAIRI